MRNIVRSVSHRAPLGILASLALLAPATAQSFNVDVGDGLLPVPSAGYTAAAGQAGTWNAVSSASTSGLTDVSGAATSVDLSTGFLGLFSFDNPSTSGDDEALMDDLQDVGGLGATTTWTFTGLADGTYQVYTYAWAPDSADFRTSVSVAGALEGAQTVGGNWPGGHVQLTTYALHTVEVSAGTISITAVTSVGFGSINGFQLVGEGGGVGTNYCSVNPNSTGMPAIMSAEGTSSIAANDLTLHAEPVPNDFYVFYYGPNQTDEPFGNGRLCVDGGVTRLLAPMEATGNLATRVVDTVAEGFVPGTVNFQCWFRDPAAGGASFNTSDGYSITFVP